MTDIFASAKPGGFGIIGHPIEHSLSPAMQNAALQKWWGDTRRSGPPPVYGAFDVKPVDLKAAIESARRVGVAGLNVTVPHKLAVCEWLDSVEGFAAETESVNTVVRDGDKLRGHNTDGPGFARAIKDHLNFRSGGTALVFGAGGTGSVLVRQLLKLDVQRVFWWNRHPARIRAEDPRIHPVNDADLKNACGESDLIVNATSVGLNDRDGLPAEPLVFRRGQAAFDVVYHRETTFLEAARRAGATALGGLPMLLYQGATAFEIWTGARAPVDLMKAALKKTLKEKGLTPVWPFDI